MSGSKVISLLENLLAPAFEACQVELVDLEYRKENRQQILRVFIDSPDGVDLDLCARCTRIVKNIVEAREDIEYDHIEVSSPGLDRVVKKERDFIRFQGQKVKVRTKETINGSKNFTGVLKDTSSEYLNLEVDGQLISLPRQMITVVRLYPEF